ncbi:hypothetical protein GCM10028822_22570 [Hymenobacter terrigena]
MRNLLTACLPALALFALGGCASTSGLVSSEDDGVYYSSKDRTTAVVSTAPAPAATSEEANPDYNGGSTNSSTRQNNSGSDQYYDNTYTYMRGVPGYGSSSYYGPGLSSYSPYSPYTSLSYGGGYAYGGGACGFSPYAFGWCDPFYSSLYSPFGYGYGYGSGLSISFGFGRSFGYGGYYGYSPYGYGYGGYYDPFYYSSPFYGGYYGRGGYYGSSYYGGAYNSGYYSNGGDRGVRNYGSHRTDRASDGRYSSGRAGNMPGAGNPTMPNGSGRTRDERVISNVPESMPMGAADAVGRTRGDAVSASPATQPMRSNDAYNKPGQMQDGANPRYRNMDPLSNDRPAVGAATEQGQIMRDDSRGRTRTMDAQPQGNGQMQPAAMPQEGQRRRGGFFQNILGEPMNSGQASEQTRQRTYDQPRQQRTYEQPQQRAYEQPQQRTYEQPQQRSYSQPSYSQPSYSAPSGGGGGGGGGGRGRGRGE